MSVMNLRQRLDRLEADVHLNATSAEPSPLATLLEVLVAHHLGNSDRNESLADGMARGLGYEKGRDLMEGLRADAGASRWEDLNARWRDAVSRLFALKGADPDCNGLTFAASERRCIANCRTGCASTS